MDNEKLKEFISRQVPDAEFEENTQYLIAVVQSELAYALLLELKNNEESSFDYMFCLTGADYAEHMEVIYHLKSTEHNHCIVIKAKISTRENPEIETVSNQWKTAEFHEREVFDLLGINFKNHSDLRRIFLEDDWEGFPLRKDYEDPINIVKY